MSACPPQRVATIGAGLSGMSLALNLHKQRIDCILFESRHPSDKAGGALMLSPNALRILDSQGLYEILSQQGYNFESLAFQNGQNTTTDTYYLGSEKLYAYKALRIYRHILLNELRNKVAALGIPVIYDKKFIKVISETNEGVVFEFADGVQEMASILVGADGIHSSVRKYIIPDLAPKYIGTMAITCAVQKSDLNFAQCGANFTLPVSIHGQAGAFVMAPQDVDGHEILAGTQVKYEEQDRAGWDALLADKDRLLALFRADYPTWPAIAQSALDNVPRESLMIWPFYVIPRLSDWVSSDGRVIILGDAAHAIPPTAGQGASQAFEDTFTLAIVLANLSSLNSLEKSL